MTHKEDLPASIGVIERLHEEGVYPDSLWGKE